MFKPMLIPNDKGKEVDWSSRIKNPKDWLVMPKRDGARVEISEDYLKGRSLKLLKNKQMLRMARYIQKGIVGKDIILEAEFYSHEMTFPEIMHFFKTEDVTSQKTKEKYEKLWKKTNGDSEKGWTYPGRSVEWLTSWHDSLKFHVFDIHDLIDNELSAVHRLAKAYIYVGDYLSIELGPFETFSTIDDILDYYNKCIDDGYEGLVLMHKHKTYKCGRATLNDNIIYKMKEDNLEFDGKIIDLIQATVVDANVPTTKNELGRTVTSKKKNDRILIEAVSGFLVEMDDGKQLTVSLRGWNDEAKQKAWKEGVAVYKNRWLKFTGMKPVKEGGVPRHAQIKCFRDSK